MKKLQASNFKLQGNSNNQTSKLSPNLQGNAARRIDVSPHSQNFFEAWSLTFLWSLDVGVWSFPFQGFPPKVT